MYAVVALSSAKLGLVDTPCAQFRNLPGTWEPGSLGAGEPHSHSLLLGTPQEFASRGLSGSVGSSSASAAWAKLSRTYGKCFFTAFAFSSEYKVEPSTAIIPQAARFRV